MDVNILKKMYKILAPSGHENKLTDFIANEIKSYVDEIYTDNLGNLIACKGNNSGKKIMLECGIDECGVMAVSIDDKGLVYLAPVGDAKAKHCIDQQVEFLNGVVGIIRTKKEDINSLDFSDLFADIDTDNKEYTEKSVKIGEFGAFLSSFREIEDVEKTVKATSLSYRILAFILTDVIKSISKTTAELYFVFSTQKNLGGRGLRTAVSNINPDVLISLNTCKTTKNIQSGMGCALLVKDAKTITSEAMRETFINISKNNNIPYQLYVGDEDFNLSGIAVSGSKSLIGGVLVPVKYKGQSYETISMTDVENTQKLFLRYIGNL